MELIIFVVYLVITLFLIGAGLYKPEHTELNIIGFFFLFLLSFNLILGNQIFMKGIERKLMEKTDKQIFKGDFKDIREKLITRRDPFIEHMIHMSAGSKYYIDFNSKSIVTHHALSPIVSWRKITK
jgi:hypothetical protein